MNTDLAQKLHKKYQNIQDIQLSQHPEYYTYASDFIKKPTQKVL